MTEKKPNRNDKTQDLISQAIGGDPRAISSLYQLYKKRMEGAVHAKLGRKLRSKMETIDLVQSVWKDALLDIDEFEYRGPDSFFHWMFTCIVRKIQDKGRYFAAKRRDPALERRLGAENTISNGAPPLHAKDPTPSQAAVTEEEKELLLRLLPRLPELQRQAIVLRTRDRMKFEEIGKKMEKSAEAARKLYERGMQLLQELIQKEG